jgi:hypothetical protein
MSHKTFSGRRFILASVLCAPLLAVGGWSLALGGTGLAASSGFTNSETAYLADLFAGRKVLRIQIEIPSRGMGDLSRRDSESGHNRPSVMATVREGGHVYTNVALHLKGGARMWIRWLHSATTEKSEV